MLTPLQKWFLVYSPLTHGRFDFFLSDTAARFDTFGQFIWLGRFWMRRLGGHNLRRSSGRDAPSATSPIVGRSDGPASSVSTWPFVGHAANTAWSFQLRSVGGGGVESDDAAVLREVAINGSQVAKAVPNAVIGLEVTPNSAGTFTVNWSYSNAGQLATPSQFNVYGDSGNGTINYSTALGSVTYDAEKSYYSFTTGVLGGSSEAPFLFAVRVQTSAGDEEANENTVMSVGANAAQYTVADVVSNVIPLAKPDRISPDSA